MQMPSAKPEHPTGNVYLDFAAATPMDPRVVDAMIPYFTEKFYNPSAPYALSRQVRDEVERARAVLAHAIGARPGNVVLTAGATEANNLAFATVSEDAHVIVDAIEHESVLACAGIFSHKTLRVEADGRVNLERVAKALKPETELVSIELANGEIGTIQPIR
ncbi:MAG: aminotransferase class V-fold PLP-dependent enzyme, partial [Atopobium sp.]|nr:aminotransferase class V-fold PLP-dependent enzyme [Atopobium sp.]